MEHVVLYIYHGCRSASNHRIPGAPHKHVLFVSSSDALFEVLSSTVPDLGSGLPCLEHRGLGEPIEISVSFSLLRRGCTRQQTVLHTPPSTSKHVQHACFNAISEHLRCDVRDDGMVLLARRSQKRGEIFVHDFVLRFPWLPLGETLFKRCSPRKAFSPVYCSRIRDTLLERGRMNLVNFLGFSLGNTPLALQFNTFFSRRNNSIA